MAFSYWRTGTVPANQGAQGTQRNNGFDGYGSNALPAGQWGRKDWNKWAYSGSCLRTDSSTDVLPNGIAIVNNNNTLVEHLGSSTYLITKIGGTDGARDAGAVSSVGAAGNFVLRLRHVKNGSSPTIYEWAAGVNDDPLTDDSYGGGNNLLFWMQGAVAWAVFENGVDLVENAIHGIYGWIWRNGSTLGYGSGDTLAAAQAAPDRTTTSTGTLYFDSSLWSIGDQFEAQFVTTIDTPMVADSGVFTYTGQVANLLVGTVLAAAQASFSYTGQAANLTAAYTLTAAQTTFSYTGQAANLLKGSALVAAQASFAYTGQAANLLRGYAMPAAQATFTYTGQAANLIAAYAMAAAQGTYTYNGQVALLERGYIMPAAQGTFTYTGQGAILTPAVGGVDTPMTAAVGTFTYSGQAVNLILGSALAAAQGSYSYTGQAAAFHVVASLAAAFGAYSYTGQDARAILNLAVFPPSGAGGSGVKVAAVIM
jgi:hypothetical protein